MDYSYFKSNNKAVRISLHLLFWVGFLFLYSVLTALSRGDNVFFIALKKLVNLPLNIASVYFTIYVLLPTFLYKRKYILFILVLLLTGCVTIVLYSLIAMKISVPLFFHDKMNVIKLWHLDYFGFLATNYFVVGIATGVKLTQRWFVERENRDMLETENLTSELALLRSQINPHFLFNTLNNIDSLVYTNKQKASVAIVKLSSILKYMLEDANTDKVPLSSEVEYLQNYLDLQMLRFTDNSFISFNVNGKLDGKFIAPMLIEPFIENAIKHGDKNAPSPGIVITLNANESKIVFMISNYMSTMKKNKDTTGGIGLQNVKRRLDLIYPAKHRLTISTEGLHFGVYLEVEL